MRKIKDCDWFGWLYWVHSCGWLDSTSSTSAGGKDTGFMFGNLVWWWGHRDHAARKGNGFLSSGLSSATLLTLFVTASHQTGHDTRSMTWRLIIKGVEGGGGCAQIETWTLLEYAEAGSLSASNLSLTLNSAPGRSQLPHWYLSYIPSNGQCGTSPFFRWVWVQGCSPDTPGSSKNALSPVGIPLKRCTSGMRR